MLPYPAAWRFEKGNCTERAACAWGRCSLTPSSATGRRAASTPVDLDAPALCKYTPMIAHRGHLLAIAAHAWQQEAAFRGRGRGAPQLVSVPLFRAPVSRRRSLRAWASYTGAQLQLRIAWRQRSKAQPAAAANATDRGVPQQLQPLLRNDFARPRTLPQSRRASARRARRAT
jgi:hypothetical protein